MERDEKERMQRWGRDEIGMRNKTDGEDKERKKR